MYSINGAFFGEKNFNEDKYFGAERNLNSNSTLFSSSLIIFLERKKTGEVMRVPKVI
jgi:hypothetical protein